MLLSRASVPSYEQVMCERHASVPLNNMRPIDHNLFVSTVPNLLSVVLCFILGDLRRIRKQRCGKEVIAERARIVNS